MRRDPGHTGPNAFANALRHALIPDPFLASWQQWGHVWAVHGSYSSTLAAAATQGATSIDLSAAPSVNDFLLIGSFSSTLSAAASAGDTSVSLGAAPPDGLLLSFGDAFGSYGGQGSVLSVSGSGPYTVTLDTPLAYDQASGATVTGHVPAYQVTAVSGTTATVPELQSPWPSATTVTALHTVDVLLDQAIGIDRLTDGTPAVDTNGNPVALTPGVRYLGPYSPAVRDYVLVGRSNMSTGAGTDRIVLGMPA